MPRLTRPVWTRAWSRSCSALVLASLVVAPLGGATPRLNISATASRTTIGFSVLASDRAPARVSILADSAFASVDLSAAPGTLLGTVTFTNETASGWQQASFSSPIAITAGTTYVVSYHTTVGQYSANGSYFSSAADNAPLHGVANGVSPNGVYVYSSSTTFPTSSFNATNYWVDVVFSTS